MKNVLLSLIILLGVAVAQAAAVPISGTVLFAGNVKMTPFGSTLNNATGLDFQWAIVTGGDGAYASVPPVTPVTFTDFIYDPLAGPVAPLWTFNFDLKTYSFELESIIIDSSKPGVLHLAGSGLLMITGYDSTPGTWTFTSQDPSLGNGTFSFSSAATVPEPATLILVGSGLAGLALAKRRRKS